MGRPSHYGGGARLVGKVRTASEQCWQYLEPRIGWLPWLVWQLSRWATGRVWQLFRWVTGRNLLGRENATQSGIPPLATLLSLAIAQAVVLVFLQYESGRNEFALFVYVVVALIVLGGMVGIMRAQQPDKTGKSIAAFNWSTVPWGTWAVCLTAAGLGGVFTLAANDRLPRKPEAQIVKLLNYDWKFDGSKGIKIRCKLATPEGIPFPRTTVTEVRLGEAVPTGWKIEHVTGYSDPDCTKELESEGPFREKDKSDDRTYVGKWRDLTNHEYWFIVALHPAGDLSRDAINEMSKQGSDVITIKTLSSD